jgi:DNA-binding PadR family transcriptional regulator
LITNKYKKQVFQIWGMPKKAQKTETESEYIELKGFLSFLILHELSLKSLCGDELSKAIGKRKNSTLTPGTIYPALKRLRRKKLIAYRRQGRKKVYSLTDIGKKEIDNLYSLFSTYFYGLKNRIVRQVSKKRKDKQRK